MKKIVLALSLLLCCSLAANAQTSFVVKAGFNFNHMDDISFKNVDQSFDSQTGFHAGIGFQYRVPLIGLSFQPELLYTQKRNDFKGQNVSADSYDFDYCTNNVEVPLNIQWGINILFLRPYIFAAPYVGYAVAVRGHGPTEDNWDDVNRFDYGLNLGAGIEIWKLQISGKYSWSFGSPFNGIDTGDWDIDMDGANMRGFELSAAFLF